MSNRIPSLAIGSRSGGFFLQMSNRELNFLDRETGQDHKMSPWV